VRCSCISSVGAVVEGGKRFHAVYTAFLAHLSLLRCTYSQATGLLVRLYPWFMDRVHGTMPAQLLTCHVGWYSNFA
jgi:hypothetical protein